MSSQIEQLQKKRFEFLHKLYEQSAGSENGMFLMWELGRNLGLNADEVSNVVEFLSGEKLIKHVAIGGYIGLTHHGRKEVEQALTKPQQSTTHFLPINFLNIGTVVQQGGIHMEKTTNFNVGTNYGQFGEVLNNCTNVINQRASGETKELLEKLRNDVEKLIRGLPSEQAEVAEKASKSLQRLVDTATEKNPDREWFSLSAKGLLEASKFVKDFTGNITGTIGQLGKVFWPDYKLPAT